MAGMRQSRRIVKLVKVAGVPVLSMIVWTAVVGYGVLAGWWHRALAPAGDTPAFMAAARQMMSSEPHGDLAIALVDQGPVGGRALHRPGRYREPRDGVSGCVDEQMGDRRRRDAARSRWEDRPRRPGGSVSHAMDAAGEPVRSQRRHDAPTPEPHGWTHRRARLCRLPARRARCPRSKSPSGRRTGINRPADCHRRRL